MSLLAVRDVSKRFGGVKALAGVTFTIESGQVLGIIGPNGAGKTTLLNCISGLTRADAGDIRWQEQSISGMPPYRIARLGIGRTFQIVRPFPSMTVRENTAMGALFGVCSHALVLNFGRTLVEGPPAEVLNDSRVIEAYLGERYAKRQREADGERPPSANG